MSFYFQNHRRTVAAMLVAAFAFLCSAGTLAEAQDQASSSASASNQPARSIPSSIPARISTS